MSATCLHWILIQITVWKKDSLFSTGPTCLYHCLSLFLEFGMKLRKIRDAVLVRHGTLFDEEYLFIVICPESTIVCVCFPLSLPWEIAMKSVSIPWTCGTHSPPWRGVGTVGILGGFWWMSPGEWWGYDRRWWKMGFQCDFVVIEWDLNGMYLC